MTKRTDPHRPGAIIPAHYEPVLGYNCATSQDGWPVPSFGITCELDGRVTDAKGHIVRKGEHSAEGGCCTSECARRALAAGKHVYGDPGKCGSCGAWFIYGELWLHVPTGDLVHLGHDCAQKYGLMMDRSEAELANGRARAAVATQIRRAEKAEDRATFLAAHPGLAQAFEVGDAASVDRAPQIIADIAERFVTYCTLSEKQIALVLKLAAEIRDPKPPAPEDVHVPAPFGKGVEFEGTIISAKLREDERYGATWKIAIKVPTAGGCWIAWGTAPAEVMQFAVTLADWTQEAARGRSLPPGVRVSSDRVELISTVLKGMQVEIKATLEKPAPRDLSEYETEAARKRAKLQNAEKHFALMRRPSGGPVTYSHPIKSKKRLDAEKAFEKALDSERSAMLAIDGSHYGKYLVPDADVRASLAAKGVTLEALVTASLEAPRKRKPSTKAAEAHP
jgi:hypothetical protein